MPQTKTTRNPVFANAVNFTAAAAGMADGGKSEAILGITGKRVGGRDVALYTSGEVEQMLLEQKEQIAKFLEDNQVLIGRQRSVAPADVGDSMSVHAGMDYAKAIRANQHSKG